MDSLLQLVQALLVLCAVGAALFAGQFSRMHRVQFNDVSKFMLIASVILVIVADLLNLVPALQLMNFGLGGVFGGNQVGYIIGYGVIELIIYTGIAYAFSYYMLTKEKLQQVYEWSEEFVRNWQQGQSSIGARQSEHEVDDIDQLQKLDLLRRKGALTDEEFEAKKKKILDL